MSLRDEIAATAKQALSKCGGGHIEPFEAMADAILAIPEIAEALRLRNAFLASQMPDLTPERVGEIMRELTAKELGTQ